MKEKGQLTFLLVDHDASGLDRATALIQEIGYYNCLQAEEGAEAWAMFKNFNIDFVISNFDVPEVNGLSLLKLIRSHEDYAATPFVLIYTSITSKLVNLAGKAGVSDIIIVPFKPEVFKNKILSIIEIEQEPRTQEVERAYKQGVDLMKAGRYDEALKSFESVISVHEEAEVYFNMGYIKSYHEEYEEALRCFRRATRINNDFARAYKQMAEVYTKMAKYDQAASCLQQAANIFMERKEDSEAEEVYEAVMKLRPETINVFNSLGIIYRRQGRVEDAIEQYQKALRVHPDDEHIYYNLARVYLETNDFENSEKALKKALEIDPEFAPAREMRRAVEMGLKIHA